MGKFNGIVGIVISILCIFLGLFFTWLGLGWFSRIFGVLVIILGVWGIFGSIKELKR